MKKYIIMMAFAGLAASCSQTEEVIPNNDQEIRIEAALPQNSRATSTKFEMGDKLALFAVEYQNGNAIPLQVSGNFLNNEAMTYNGSQWNATRKLYWSDTSCDFYGIYPYQEVTSIDAQLFDIATDQSIPETQKSLSGYEASDLMWAKVENVSRGKGDVKLQFKHMMSKVVVKLHKGVKFEGDLPEDISTHIYNTATTAMVNWQKGSLEKYALSKNNTIKMRRMDEETFEAIVVPQFIERNTPLIEITMEGIAYLLEYSMSFRPGYQHTITVTLNTSPDQEKIEINIEGDVEDWGK